MEMTDIGEEVKETKACEDKIKDEKRYPTLYLSSKQLPELKDKKAGDTGKLVIDYKIIRSSIRLDENDKEESTYDIEVKKIGVSNKSADETVSEEKETEKLKKDVKKGLKAGRSY